MGWFPLHSHSAFSFKDAISKPEQIAERIVECGFTGSASTDHGNVASVPSIVKTFGETCVCGQAKLAHDDNGKGACVKKGSSCKEFKKASLKAIAGCEFYLCEQHSTVKDKTNAKLAHLCVLAKGQQGWKNLIKAVSESNRLENFYHKPRLSLDQLGSFAKGELIAFSGHMGSELANICFAEPKLAYNTTTYDDARKLVHNNWKSRVCNLIAKYQKLFGRENFFVEIQLIDSSNLPSSLVVAKILRHCAKLTGTPKIATADSHYPRRVDAADQRIVLCAGLQTTLKEVYRKLDDDEEVGLSAFFKSNSFHIPSCEEMHELHKDEPDELANTLKIAELCQTPSIASPPMLPAFDCPDGKTPDEYVRKLCVSGWEEKIAKQIAPEKHPEYQQRLETELHVINEFGLSSYFLIKWDMLRYAREVLKARTGKGRGSAAGSFVAYLLHITRVDPIRFGLLFERFINAGRMSKDRVSLPDIDSDFPKGIRDLVFEYLCEKYGHDRVCQMGTFEKLKGCNSLKAVLRAHERVSFEEMNRITKYIPDDAAISDELQEMMEETGQSSIILWALENNAEDLKEWCWLNEEGELEGPLAIDFAQAIRLEGTKNGMGKHASGVLISSEPLAEVFPMVADKSSDRMITGIDMRDVELMGGVKFDLLALRTLNAIQDAEHVIRTGSLPE